LGSSGSSLAHCSLVKSPRPIPGASDGTLQLLKHAHKAPDHIEFVEELPKTSTGKIQKFALRDKEWAGRDTKVQG
jgi:acyl-CoA synthetase (AMP-forming)/AMP-acid ligase II